LLALDALRGFDMFWIVGADGIVHALHRIGGNPVVDLLSAQLSHKPWRGFAFYDLIFPMFVFMVGVSIVFSLRRAREQGGTAAAIRRVLSRGLLLYVVGLLYYGGISKGFDQVRLMGVLQRIAIAYTGAALLFLVLRQRGLMIAAATILLGYWGLLALVPIRDIAVGRGTTPEEFSAVTNWVSGVYEPGRNLTNHLDFLYLGGRRYGGAYDPEGLLSNLPAIGSCLLGVLSGLLLASDRPPDRKVRLLIGAGAASVALGFLWGLAFPVIKNLWTSSFVLVAGGWSAILLGVFFQVIEVQGHRRWATPFVWIGMNALTIYLLRNLVDWNGVAGRFVGGPIKGALGAWGDLMVTLVGLFFGLLIVRFMYQRKIFLRL
jgi:predicted acyltransferase